MGEFIGGLLLVGFLLLLLASFLRVLLSVVGLGLWVCSKGWHWYRDFPLHVRQGLTSRTTTYLAIAGVRINQCRTCGVFSPPEGQVVYEQWRRGGVKTEGGGIFTGPKVKADAEAARAINQTLSKVVEKLPPPKPKPPPPRWIEVIGASVVVQGAGKYLMVLVGIGGMITVFGGLAEACDRRSSGGEAFVTLLVGGGLLALAWGIAALMDAGSARYTARSLAREATKDPVAFFNRTVRLARERGVEVPPGLTPELLAEKHRSSAAAFDHRDEPKEAPPSLGHSQRAAPVARRAVPSDIVKETLAEVEKVRAELMSGTLGLPEELMAEVRRQVSDAARTAHTVQVDGVAPRLVAWLVVSNVAGELIACGHYHVYRGVLGMPGRALQQAFVRAVQELERGGVHDAAGTAKDLAWLRERIREAG